jgi:hypothetical protein
MGKQYGMREGDKDTKGIKERIKQIISPTFFDESCTILQLLLLLLVLPPPPPQPPPISPIDDDDDDDNNSIKFFIIYVLSQQL